MTRAFELEGVGGNAEPLVVMAPLIDMANHACNSTDVNAHFTWGVTASSAGSSATNSAIGGSVLIEWDQSNSEKTWPVDQQRLQIVASREI